MRDKYMSFFDHLEELRTRIIISGAAILLVTAVAFFFSDPILKLIPEQRRGTLIAAVDSSRDATLLWNIQLQGERETVFFDC